MESNEINSLASEFAPPFRVSNSQLTYYRKTRQVEIDAIISAGEHDALSTGLALRDERVKRLKQLAALLEKDLFGGFLWIDQIKSIGNGERSEIIEYEEFNKAEVDSYRGVLDDIAKEVGGRINKQELTGQDGAPLVINLSWADDYSNDNSTE